MNDIERIEKLKSFKEICLLNSWFDMISYVNQMIKELDDN